MDNILLHVYRNQLWHLAETLYDSGKVYDAKLGSMLEGLANIFADIQDGKITDPERLKDVMVSCLIRNWTENRRG